VFPNLIEIESSQYRYQGGHYMRPDLVRLLVDTKRKNLIVEEDRENGGVVYTQTIDRVGLSTPLDAASNETNNE
jgi:cyanide hydratase